jgi:long-subunit fatty acid transport protein
VKQIDAQDIDVALPIFDTPQNGVDVSPEKTLPGSALGVVPSAGAYMPLPGMENLVVGVGVGTPFLVSANYGNDDAPGNFTKFNTTDAALIVVETAPTVGVKVNDQLNVGASVGVTTFKYLKLSNALGLTSFLGEPGLGTTPLGTADLETDSDFGLPVPPWGFATEPTSVSFTLGLQYQVTSSLAIGVTYRSETPETFEGDSTVVLNGPVIGAPDILTVEDRFKYEMELPRHLQVGAAYDVTPQWRIMADVRWTNWSDAKGFGSASVIEFQEGTLAKTLTVNYQAEDAYSFHFGTAYKLTDNLELQAGYIYDQAFMPEEAVDLVTLSSDRHILSLGGTYTKPTDEGEWAFTLGGQIALYESRTIEAGESDTLGGATDALGGLATGNLEYSSNFLGGIDIGGYVWSVGASVSYKFGAPAQELEQTSLEPLK